MNCNYKRMVANQLDEDNGNTDVEVQSRNKNGKKHRREPKSMTDEEYEEIFAAVLAATPVQLKETNKPATEEREDDFDAVLHEDGAYDVEDDEADCKAEEEEEVERDDGVIGDELNIDDLPQDVRADVLQMTNELTPCTSDVEDSAGQKTPELPPKVLHKKHSSSSKKQTMKPKQLKFDKNMGDKDASKKSIQEDGIEDSVSGSRKEDGHNKCMVTHDDIPATCKQIGTFHKKKMMTDNNSRVTDTCNYNGEKGCDEVQAHKKTRDKIKKRTSDGVTRSKETGGVGDNIHRNKKTKKVSKRQKMLKRQLEETGTWVQCTSTFCMKWRHLPHVHDPSSLPGDWVCHMNADDKYDSCDVPQQQFDQREHDENYVFTTYTEGSIVWARVDGFPWWPAMVEIDPDYEDFYECRGPRNKATHYHVVFFDDKVSRAWLATERLKPFTDIDELGTVKMRGVDHSKVVNAARSKALQALNMSLKDRLQNYSFSVRYSGRWGINNTEDDSQNSQVSSSSSTFPQVSFVKKDRKPQKTEMTGKADLEAFELGDNDVEEMLNDAEGIMKDAEEILEVFFPSENEEVMSDYEPEKPKKAKEKKKKAKEENVLGKDSRSVKTKSSKRKLNEDGSDKKCKKKKSSTDKPTTGAKEKKKVKSSSSADTPKIKPSFQQPKLEKILKTKAIKQPTPQPELDSDVLKMEVSCYVAESLPKKCSETAKKHVTNNDKENANPSAQTKPHMGDSDAPKLVSHEEKIMTKPKVLVKPKFVAPNAHKLTKAKSKDGSTDVVLTKDKDQTNVATTKNKKFSIKKTSAHEKTNKKTHEKANEKTTQKKNAKKTKEGAKNMSMDGEDTAKTTPEASKDLAEKNSSPRSLDDITNDLSIDIEDKLFPDLELSSAMDRRPECDGDNDSEPFDMEPVDGAVTDITSSDKLHILIAEYDSDPMEFEE